MIIVCVLVILFLMFMIWSVVVVIAWVYELGLLLDVLFVSWTPNPK